MPSECAQKQEKPNVEAIFVTFAAVLAALMIVAGLVLRTKIAEQNDINVEISAQLAELNEENTRLKIEIYSAYELCELENEARNELGMLPPGAEQTAGIDVKTEDKAVVIGNGEDKAYMTDNWISSLRNIFSIEK